VDSGLELVRYVRKVIGRLGNKVLYLERHSVGSIALLVGVAVVEFG
jgi:hypothetical protein